MKLEISVKTYRAAMIALRQKIIEREAEGFSAAPYIDALQELEAALIAADRAVSKEIADQSTHVH